MTKKGIIFSLILFFMLVNISFAQKKAPKQELTTFVGTVQSASQLVDFDARGQQTNYFVLYLKEYPNKKFLISPKETKNVPFGEGENIKGVKLTLECVEQPGNKNIIIYGNKYK